MTKDINVVRETSHIQGSYFRWLMEQVGVKSRRDRYGEYIELLFELHTIKFRQFVAHDDNRIADGLRLRLDYGVGGAVKGPCTVLEMLVALAIRIGDEIMPDFDGVRDASYWFWLMIGNLGLLEFDDHHWDRHSVDRIVEGWMDRKYRSNGCGGLFPLKYATQDQRDVEIWYQCQAYIMENYDI